MPALQVKYRHYGVYRTGESEDKEQAVLTNPVTVLDRSSVCRDIVLGSTLQFSAMH